MSDAAESPQPVTAVAGIKALVDNADRLGLKWDLKPATIFSITPNITAIYDGDSVPIAMTSLVGRMEVGLRVYAIQVPPAAHFIAGFATDVNLLTVNERFLTGGPSQSTTSAITVNILGPGSVPFSVDIQKKFNGTSLRVDIAATAFVSGTTAAPIFGVLISGVTGANTGVVTVDTNMQVIAITNSLLNSHTNWSATNVINQVGKGLANVQLKWARFSGTGTLNMDSNDCVSMTVSEVWES